MATQILLKLTQFPPSPSSSPPNNIFNMILAQLNGWLNIIPNLFQTLITKLQETFSKEHLEHWLAVAKPYLLAGLGVVLLCLVCFCLLPAILGFIAWVVALIWGLIVGLFMLVWSVIRGLFMLIWSVVRGLIMLLWNACRSLFRVCCGCCRRSGKLMKAPGMGGKVYIPRVSFEANPRDYFINLRAGGSVNGYSLLR